LVGCGPSLTLLINNKLVLKVYTHKSLNTKPGAITVDEHGGSAILTSAVMTNLFQRQPMLNTSQVQVGHPSVAVVSGLSM
jgi:hypothetical protein